MNNLLLASVLLGSGAIICFGQHAAFKHGQAANQLLAEELNSAQTSLAGVMEASSNAQAGLARQRTELKTLEADLASSAGQQRGDISPLDPAREGFWPPDKPYFYLPKKDLRAIGYTTFSADHRLTQPAATVLGMSGAERSAVDDACESFHNALQQLQIVHGERLETAREVDTGNHRELSFKIPAMTNEIQAARGQWESAIQQAVGPTRAELLIAKGEEIDMPYGEFQIPEGPRIVTYSADRNADGTVRHHLKVELPGSATYFYQNSFPIQPTDMIWNYRHLFGDQPLIPLPATDAPANK